MRTTVTLDDDVAAAVDKVRREKGVGLSEALNHLVRDGLRRGPRKRPFKQRSARIGLTIDVSNVAEALEILEGPTAR
jgi:metal-responsive CopG/Arc/MetJ family transcriptional regulator